jgi:3D (Asp-Asp-Asp) domain-containing protein
LTATLLVSAAFAALSMAVTVAPVAAIAKDGAEEVVPEPLPEPVSEDAGYVVLATVTGYANGSDGGAVGTVTASGTTTHWGTVAADWSHFPLGTRMQIEGFDDVVFVVEDTGSGVRGLLVDIWFPDVGTAQAFGMQTRQIRILP